MQGDTTNFFSVSQAKKYYIQFLNWCQIFICLPEPLSQDDDQNTQNCLLQSRLCCKLEDDDQNNQNCLLQSRLCSNIQKVN
jgi:hypothetical protein